MTRKITLATTVTWTTMTMFSIPVLAREAMLTTKATEMVMVRRASATAVTFLVFDDEDDDDDDIHNADDRDYGCCIWKLLSRW